jgi:hypothetical protein
MSLAWLCSCISSTGRIGFGLIAPFEVVEEGKREYSLGSADLE